jgi:hypothetical protein
MHPFNAAINRATKSKNQHRNGQSTVQLSSPHQHFLARGGSNEMSTASNSNLGSSASGAKYAFVVFRKF